MRPGGPRGSRIAPDSMTRVMANDPPSVDSAPLPSKTGEHLDSGEKPRGTARLIEASAPQPSFVHVGQVVQGKYQIEKLVGVGGMGFVVSAMHLGLGERVALKFTYADILSDADAMSRFEREARAAAKLKSEHVARVIDVGTLEVPEEDLQVPYIVMEYLEGRTLENYLEERRALPLEEAAELILQAADAMAEAHQLGVVHRDLKPANLFITTRPDGSRLLKVLDFGVSKARLGQSEATITGTKMGTPAYMAPEQAMCAKDVDGRADVWSMGVLLYEMLAGVRPFDGDSLAEVLDKVTLGEPPPLDKYRKGLPTEVYTLVRRCLVKDRNTRTASMAELASWLGPFAPPSVRHLVERAQRSMPAPPVPLPPPALRSVPPAPYRKRSRSELVLSWGIFGFAMVLFVTVVLVLGLVVLYRARAG